jgi:hypothetical protein
MRAGSATRVRNSRDFRLPEDAVPCTARR